VNFTASCQPQQDGLLTKLRKHWDNPIGTASWHVFAPKYDWDSRGQALWITWFPQPTHLHRKMNCWVGSENNKISQQINLFAQFSPCQCRTEGSVSSSPPYTHTQTHTHTHTCTHTHAHTYTHWCIQGIPLGWDTSYFCGHKSGGTWGANRNLPSP
jgi:hypothetical protein